MQSTEQIRYPQTETRVNRLAAQIIPAHKIRIFIIAYSIIYQRRSSDVSLHNMQ